MDRPGQILADIQAALDCRCPLRRGRARCIGCRRMFMAETCCSWDRCKSRTLLEVLGPVDVSYSDLPPCFCEAIPNRRCCKRSELEISDVQSRTQPLIGASPSQRLPDARSFPDLTALRRHAAVWRADYVTHKSWSIVARQHRPDAVVFLGNLLDSGVESKSTSLMTTLLLAKRFSQPKTAMSKAPLQCTQQATLTWVL